MEGTVCIGSEEDEGNGGGTPRERQGWAKEIWTH